MNEFVQIPGDGNKANAGMIEVILDYNRVGGATPLAEVTNMIAHNLRAMGIQSVSIIQFRKLNTFQVGMLRMTS